MDGVAGKEEFPDWELLHPNSDTEGSPNSVSSVEENGLIHTNYFSLDSPNVHADDSDDKKSAESNNPSWIDPASEENPSRFLNRDPGEFWSDSGSDRSDERKIVDSDCTGEVGLFENGKKHVNFEGSDEIVKMEEKYADNFERFYSGSGGIVVESLKFNDFGENSEVISGGNLNRERGSEVLGEEKQEKVTVGTDSESIHENGDRINGEIGKRSVPWWKMPIEILKCCMSRASPVWAVSVAAAVMGFVILGRSLYKMKKKSRGLEIKVTLDDKRVSQFMTRAARLNEAFSVVKRVPVIRPSLPAVGVTTWPAMSLR